MYMRLSKYVYVHILFIMSVIIISIYLFVSALLPLKAAGRQPYPGVQAEYEEYVST